MPESFNPHPWITLRVAVNNVRRSRKIDHKAAQSLLRELIKDRVVRARGRVHHPALKDKAGGWLVTGDTWTPYERHAGGDPERIDATTTQWDKADVDWFRNIIDFGASAVHDATIEAASLFRWLRETQPVAAKGQGGRPDKYDWREFDKEIMRRMQHPDWPPTRRELIRSMLVWAGENMKDAPDDRTIEQHIDALGLDLE